MTNQQDTTAFSRGDRIKVTLFGVFFGLYIINILLGKATIVFGWKTYHLGNVGEFLILLAASVAFVAAALHREAVMQLNRKPEKE